VRFDAPAAGALAERLQGRGVPPEAAHAAARLALGDGEKARALALADGPELRARAEAFARAPATDRPWRPLLELARAHATAAREQVEQALADELAYLPRKEHRRRETEYGERARRAERRAHTATLDHALQLAGLWYRDLVCVAAGAEELVHHTDRLDALRADAPRKTAAEWRAAVDRVEDTRARLALNVSEELALEALAYRLAEA